jgi:hypothetical protein
MTPAQITGWTALAFTCVVAAWRGRVPERLGAAVIAAAWVATTLVEQRDSWLAPQTGILAIDMVTLAALIGLGVRYDRYWPIWAGGFQAVAVLTDLAFLIEPRALYRAYYFGNFSIGFVLLGALLGGVIIERDRPFRRRLPPRRAPRSSQPPA